MADLADVKLSLAGLGAVTGTATTTVTAGQCTCTVGGINVVVNVARDLVVAVGDVLLIVRQGSARWAVARLFTAAPPAPLEPPDLPPPPKPTTVTGTLVVAPVATATHRDGSWRTDTDDVLQGVYGTRGNNTGAAFYGSKPRSLAGATVTSASIRVRRDRAGVFAAQTSTLRLVTQATKPSGAPTLTSSTTGPSLAVGATNNAFTIPTSWGQQMVDGTAGGLAVYDADGSPYLRFAGRGSWSAAWTLTIKWRERRERGREGLTMPTTPRGIEYPASTAHTRLWEHFQTLADDVDGLLGLTVCTSTTRPASPYQGMQVYETDTADRYFWNGASWWPEDGLKRIKSADTVRNNTTTLTADPHLAVPVITANTRYILSGFLKWAATTVADIKFDLSFPTGATWEANTDTYSRDAALGSQEADTRCWNQSDGSPAGSIAIAGGGAGTGQLRYTNILDGILNVASTTGTITLRWAQAALEASNVTLYSGSWLELDRIA